MKRAIRPLSSNPRGASLARVDAWWRRGWGEGGQVWSWWCEGGRDGRVWDWGRGWGEQDLRGDWVWESGCAWTDCEMGDEEDEEEDEEEGAINLDDAGVT